jgi:hypothetical protein
LPAWISFSVAGGGGSGSNPVRPWPEYATTLPRSLNRVASCTPACSRRAPSTAISSVAGLCDSASAMASALPESSLRAVSSMPRPRFRPLSSALSSRTSNQDSIERARKCTDMP